MNISFTNDDPMNTLVVDAKRSKALYEVQTISKSIDKVTTIRSLPESPVEPEAGSSSSTTISNGYDSGRVVAEIEWHKTRPSKVAFQKGKRSIPLNMYLHYGSASGLFRLSRVFIAPNGKEFMWKLKNERLELIERGSESVVVEPRGANGLYVHKPAAAFLDQVLLTYIVMEKKRRDHI